MSPMKESADHTLGAGSRPGWLTGTHIVNLDLAFVAVLVGAAFLAPSYVADVLVRLPHHVPAGYAVRSLEEYATVADAVAVAVARIKAVASTVQRQRILESCSLHFLTNFKNYSLTL